MAVPRLICLTGYFGPTEGLGECISCDVQGDYYQVWAFLCGFLAPVPASLPREVRFWVFDLFEHSYPKPAHLYFWKFYTRSKRLLLCA
jgi:hypothetical protein